MTGSGRTVIGSTWSERVLVAFVPSKRDVEYYAVNRNVDWSGRVLT